MKLSKSLTELDAMADQLLKSEDLAPEDVSENAKQYKDAMDQLKPKGKFEDDEGEDKKSTTDAEDVKKSCDGDDCDVKKSDNADVDPDEKSEELNKSDDDADEKPEGDDSEEIEKSEKVNEDDDSDEDEKSEGDSDEDEEPEDDAEDVEKSIRHAFESDPVISAKMQDSEFYSAVVDVLSKSLSDVQYDLMSNGKSHRAGTDVIAKSMLATMAMNKSLKADNERLSRRLNKLEKSISQGFDRINDSLNDIASQPIGMRKSLASVSVHERDFDRSLNGQKTVGGFETMNKSQVLQVLNTELYNGNPTVTPRDIISYESGAPLRSDLKSLVESKWK